MVLRAVAQKRWLDVTDFVAPLVPLGLAAGRLGNFINGELWGRTTDSALGMVFPPAGPEPRHPSQLYQFALEGLLLFAVLWIYTRRRRPLGAASGLFLVGYGLCRFVVEFAREPDSFLGYLALGLTMGQWLSLPMILDRRGDAAPCLPACGQGRADAARPDEVSLVRINRDGEIRHRWTWGRGGNRRPPPRSVHIRGRD